MDVIIEQVFYANQKNSMAMLLFHIDPKLRQKQPNAGLSKPAESKL